MIKQLIKVSLKYSNNSCDYNNVDVVRCHGSQWNYRSKIEQDALGKLNRVKEIRRREKVTDNSIMWGRKCHESKVWGEGEGLWDKFGTEGKE